MNFFISLFSKHVVPLAFAGLSILILGGMLAPGYILTLDMLWSDTISWKWSADGFNNTAPIYLLLSGLGLIFPSWIVQKLMLFGLFFSLLYLPYRFLPFITFESARIFAGLLYALNPFVYSRLLAGQWGVLFGYALLPLVLYALVRLVEKPERRSGFILAGVLLLMGACSIHFLYLSLIGSFLWLAIYATKALYKSDYFLFKKLVKTSLMGMVIFFSVSAYWLIPAMERQAPLETRFNTAHFAGFAASENHMTPTLLNLSVLGGFWGEGEEWRYYFVWPQEQTIFWVVAGLLFILILYGFFIMFRTARTRLVAVVLLLTGLTSYILALGAWGGPLSSFNMWLYANLPGWSGLRDSHKIAGVLALVYVLFASVGFSQLNKVFSEKKPELAKLLLPSFFIIPIIFGMYELNGFHGQLIPTKYPTAWYEAKTILAESPEIDKMLVLPWQGYYSLPFANQLIVANPTDKFFGKNKVISGRSVGIEGIYDQEVDTNYRAIDNFLHEAESLSTKSLIDVLRQNDIRYLFVVVNPLVKDQNTWLLPERDTRAEETTIVQVENPQEAKVVQALLQVPHEILLDSDVLLYRFIY